MKSRDDRAFELKREDTGTGEVTGELSSPLDPAPSPYPLLHSVRAPPDPPVVNLRDYPPREGPPDHERRCNGH